MKNYFNAGLGTGIVPVCPRTQSCQVQMPARSFSVTATTLPLIPAYALLVDESQGMTYNWDVIGPLRHSTRRCPQKSSDYVAFSPVTNPDHQCILEKLELSEMAYFTPKTDVVQETRRLEALEAQ